jgi:death-on-curing family protein
MSDYIWPDIKGILDDYRVFAEARGETPAGGARNAIEAGYHRARNALNYVGTPDIADVAARLFEGIAMRHPLVDENKRIALHCMTVFLDRNEANFDPPEIELYQHLMEFMRQNSDMDALAAYIRQHCVELPQR